LTERVARAE
jgi:hypothetical protein